MIEPARGNPRGAAYCAKQQDEHWIRSGKHLKEARAHVNKLHGDKSKRERQGMVMPLAKLMGQCLLNAVRTGHTIMTHHHGTPS